MCITDARSTAMLGYGKRQMEEFRLREEHRLALLEAELARLLKKEKCK